MNAVFVVIENTDPVREDCAFHSAVGLQVLGTSFSSHIREPPFCSSFLSSCKALPVFATTNVVMHCRSQ